MNVNMESKNLPFAIEGFKERIVEPFATAYFGAAESAMRRAAEKSGKTFDRFVLAFSRNAEHDGLTALVTASAGDDEFYWADVVPSAIVLDVH